MPQPVPGILPLELSPRRDRALLSKPPCSLAVIHRRSEDLPSRILSPPVSPTPTLRCSSLVPPETMGPLSANRVLASRSPWIPNSEAASSRQLHLLRSLVPPANSFVPCPSCPKQSSRYSRVSAPLERDPPRLGSYDPPEPEGPNTPPRPKARRRDPRDLATPRAR
jgi:hypothetical protein